MATEAAEPARDEELFDPEFLQRLRTLFFKLRRRRQLRQKGLQQTPSAGFTREFKDHRAYTSRDDFRQIDWRLFARLERLYIRLYEAVEEFHVHILVDRSASMRAPFPGKRVMALRLAAALTYLALMNQHRVSLQTFTDDVRREFPPLKGQGHIHAVLKHLAGVEFAGVTDLERALARFRPQKQRRGMVFLLSDLLGQDPQRAAPALEQAIRWPAETHVVHILHPQEVRPALEGEVQLVDTETGEQRRLSLSPRDLERYTQAFARYQAELEQTCLRRRIDYVPWMTDASFEQLFLSLLSRGSSLAQA